jgi:hypothetical protein
VSLDAGESPGRLITAPFVAAGEALSLNVRVPGGEARVTVRDPQGTLVAVSVPLIGDLPHGRVDWARGSWSELAGSTITLEIDVRQGELFSWWAD